MFDRLGSVRQPWLFVGLTVGFGLIAYLASGGSAARGTIGGVAFGAAVSGWLRLRTRFFPPRDDHSSEEPPH